MVQVEEFEEDIPRLVQLSLESKASANEHLSNGETERACELYKRAISRINDIALDKHPEAKDLLLACYLNLSLARLRMDEPQRARNAATRALELFPRSEKALYRRADAARRQGDLGEAVADLKAVLAENPRNSAAVKLLQEIRAQQKATAANVKEMAGKMLAAGDEQSERQSACQANNPDQVKDREADLKAPSSWGMFGGSNSDQAREPVMLPPGWEVISGENGEEIWQRVPHPTVSHEVEHEPEQLMARKFLSDVYRSAVST